MARVTIARIPWRYWRRLTQALCLLAFLWLFRQTELRDDAVPGFVNLAFRLDPLIAASAMLAARAFIAGLLLCLITIAITIAFGRAFCGWICPLGTLLDWLGRPIRIFKRRKNEDEVTRRWRPVRYWLLVLILFGALFGLPLVGFFDPFSLLVQGLTLVVDPGLKWLADAGFGWLYFNAPESVTNVSEPVYSFLGEHVLPVEQFGYVGAGISAAVLVVIFLLERVQRRFWCRNLCPLGALLGIVARLAPFARKPAKACGKCGECAHTCRMGAFDGQQRLQPQACVVCMDCVDSCPNNIALFKWRLPKKRPPGKKPKAKAPMDFSRRSFVGACITGAALPAAHGAARATGILPSDVRLLRPPGALEGDAFLNLCVRCGECLKVCITNGLQPVLLEAGPAGLFTPKLVPRTGYCEYNCTQCLDVCPTGAIRPLDLEAKQKFIMGEAVFDEELCLPLKEEDDCIVCEEHCPLPEKAIKLEEVEVDHPEYGRITLRKPSVDLELCIGCGICENVCPLEDEPGVVVVPVSEERGDVNAEIDATT